MVINEAGTAFVHAEAATPVDAFRAWLVAPTEAEDIVIGMEEVLGITTTPRQQSSDVIYDLQGRRSSGKQKGIYILNNKKFIKH